VREDLRGAGVHRCSEATVCHLPSGGRCIVFVAGDAAVDAEPWGGGDLGYLQDEVPGEIFLGQCEARARSRVPHVAVGNYDCGGLHREVRVPCMFLHSSGH